MGQSRPLGPHVRGAVDDGTELDAATTEALIGFMGRGGETLGPKVTQLVNAALAVASQCELCIDEAVRRGLAVGATRDEIIEAGMLAVVAHGGPALRAMQPLLLALDAAGADTPGP
jgi:AhpD family alkylhydroperoxidase